MSLLKPYRLGAVDAIGSRLPREEAGLGGVCICIYILRCCAAVCARHTCTSLCSLDLIAGSPCYTGLARIVHLFQVAREEAAQADIMRPAVPSRNRVGQGRTPSR